MMNQLTAGKYPWCLGKDSRRAIRIKQANTEGQVMTMFYGAAEASRITGISRTSIKNCLNGYSKTAGGFRWEYAD